MRTENSAGDVKVLDFSQIGANNNLRVLFIYPNVQRVRTPQMGVAVLSACLKRIGVTTHLFDTTTIKRGDEVARFKEAIDQFQPHLLAYSVRSNEWPMAKLLLEFGRSQGITQIVGGVHATHAPDEVIPHANAIVIGEGEGAIMDIARHLAQDLPLSGIPNTWVNTSDGVVKTKKRVLIPNLDDIPFPDWRLFDDEHYSRSYMTEIVDGISMVAPLEASRGCPYQCSYCSNEALRNSYAGLGKWRREKSPQRIVAELEAFRREFGHLDFVYGIDDIWMTKVSRLRQFRDLYKQRVNVPFRIMDRPECITEEKFALLVDAGMQSIAIGLESGDEIMRAQVLNRNMTTDTLAKAFLLPKKYGVDVHAFNMLGLPGQGVRSMLKTWRFLRKVKPTTAQFTIFFPLKGTKLYREAIQKGMCSPDDSIENVYSGTVLKQDGLDGKLVVQYQRLLSKYAAQPGIAPVIWFHLLRKSPNIYQLRFEWAPRFARQINYFRRRLRKHWNKGLRHLFRYSACRLLRIPTEKSTPAQCVATNSQGQ